MKKDKLLDKANIKKAITRLSHEIIENNSNLDKVVVVGILSRGDVIAKKIIKQVHTIKKISLKYGTLDVTFHRDDFLTNLGSPKIGPSNITHDLNNMNVILIDDVLYTGRTIRAAMNEIFSFGRPASIKLCVLVDRGHRELPIKANYIGKNLPTSIKEHIFVHVKEIDGTDEVFMRKFDE